MIADQITLKDITVSYPVPSDIYAVKNLSFTIHQGEFVCLVGPSGCGKSTTLHVIAGFIKPQSGEALLNGQPIKKPGSDRAVVFQDQNLFFWRTVAKNVEFGLETMKADGSHRIQLAQDYLRMVGIADLSARYPSQLSGGEKQRVALARALATDPTTLLLDEPFRSLDAQSKITMQELLLDVWDKKKRAVLFVTHDLDEAIFLADRVLVMTSKPGKIKIEVSIPFERPRSYQSMLSPEFLRIKKHIVALLREEVNMSRHSTKTNGG